MARDAGEITVKYGNIDALTPELCRRFMGRFALAMGYEMRERGDDDAEADAPAVKEEEVHK